ncbi:MAG: ABC transporter ATP-binding protein [Alphaproteobacteria bacterium]|nr:ABC transporter ATP-binding protein [Alphaproteobacteria bacterium]TAD87415.1 MAG: ABC transporter ATP-binding protein [Alphaproteobacteria bacterium]
MSDTVLEVQDLAIRFRAGSGYIHAVDGISFAVARGETLGIVGESGCGKSVTALSILRLLPKRGAEIARGHIHYGGRDLTRLSEREMAALRGDRLAMIFQEPMTSLNPVLTVGTQIAESVRRHRGLSRAAAWAHAVEMLTLVRIPDPDRRAGEYPHQLSGGMRQRVMIALALACTPDILIADEPTTALDVTIQAQILTLISDLQQRTGAAVVLITHDLGVVAETCQRVIVMYAGRVVETATVSTLFRSPSHPYTRGLMRALPHLDEALPENGTRRRLAEIPGLVPRLTHSINGCAFAPRCAFATDRCRTETPPLMAAEDGHAVACWEAARVAAEPL